MLTTERWITCSYQKMFLPTWIASLQQSRKVTHRQLLLQWLKKWVDKCKFVCNYKPWLSGPPACPGRMLYVTAKWNRLIKLTQSSNLCQYLHKKDRKANLQQCLHNIFCLCGNLQLEYDTSFSLICRLSEKKKLNLTEVCLIVLVTQLFPKVSYTLGK